MTTREKLTQEQLDEIISLHELLIREKTIGVRADLTLLDLSGLDFTRRNLYGAILKGTDLSRANLTGANFTLADLRGADLTGANLSGANFTGALMEGVDLRQYIKQEQPQ